MDRKLRYIRLVVGASAATVTLACSDGLTSPGRTSSQREIQQHLSPAPGDASTQGATPISAYIYVPCPSCVVRSTTTTRTYSARVSGGSAPYRYEWYINNAGTGGADNLIFTDPSISMSFACSSNGDNYFTLRVIDASGQVATASYDQLVQIPGNCF